MPNRVYQELVPDLKEEVEGKGKFFGEIIQEIQPKFKAMDLGLIFDRARLSTLVAANVLLVIASILTLSLAFTVADAYIFAQALGNATQISASQVEEVSSHISSIIHLFLVGVLIRAFAKILENSAHLFFAEMLFESNLIYLKVEGTFTESKISTGASIHDSTRSENTLVRSSITPWVIVCRLVSSTFAATGIRNLEYPRYILEMHKNDAELSDIRSDIINFLKDRESIAAITSERDLRNASQIHEINKQSRAISTHESSEALSKMEEDAGGYLRQQAERDAEPDQDK